jgi:hypothetical protein
MLATEVLAAGKFLTESLAEYETQITETVYPEYWAEEGQYHSARADLPFGALKYTTARMDYTGRAANFGGKATTIPLANFGINMDEYKCLVGVLAAEWDWQQLRAEEQAQRNQFLPQTNIVESYRKALEKGLREWMHIRAVYGDPTIGFTGLLNNPFVEVISIAAGANGVTGPAATAATAYEFFRSQLSAFRKDSRLTAEATIALVDEDIRSALQRRFADNSNDGTPEQILAGRTSSPMLQAIRTVNELAGDVVNAADMGNLTTIGGVTIAATDDLMLLTENSGEDAIIRHYAPIETLPPGLLDDQLTFRQVGMCATSEVIYTQPFRARLLVLKKS